jgi:PST family polysaccharide transporter
MIHTIKNIANTEEKKQLLSNFFSLSVLQGANYILPLITVPYLVRVLGAEYYGLLAFASTTVAYFQILTDYGFNLTATREISIHREDKAKVTEIFSSVMIIKFTLMLLSFLLLTILVFTFEKFRKDALVYFLSFGAVVGQVLFPVWFFQGMERMKYITYINIGSRLLFTVAIFIFVQEKSDFYMVPILSSLGTIIGGAYALYFIRTNFNLKFAFQRIEILIYHLKEAHHIFISNIAISFYTISTTFILGIFTNNIIVGYYAAADKIIQALKGLFVPISQTLYPYISKKITISPEDGKLFIRKTIKYTIIFFGILSINLFIFANSIVLVVFGLEYEKSIIILRFLSIIPLFTSLSNLLGTQLLLTHGFYMSYRNVLIKASILSVILSIVLVPFFNYYGTVVTLIFIEAFVLISLFIETRKHKLI